MRLTSFTDYGLRVLMRMARAPERSLSVSELASDLAVSRNHLAKVVSALAAAGFVATRRGGGGGARLARPAAEIRIGDVVRFLESDQALVECFAPGKPSCSLLPLCGLKGRLRAAEEAFLAELDQSTLADCIRPAAAGALRLPQG